MTKFTSTVVLIMTLAALATPSRAQGQFNPREIVLPTPLEAVINAAIDGWHGDLEGLVGALLNSPGDAFRVKLKIEGSGGAGGGGGALIEFVGDFTRNDAGRYELAIGGDVSAFAGAEVIQDVEAKAAATLGGKVVFAFATAQDAVTALGRLSLIRLGDDLDLIIGRALESVQHLETFVSSLKERVAEATARLQVSASKIDEALRSLNRIPGGKLFNAVRDVASRVLRAVRNVVAETRSVISKLGTNLQIKERLLAKARAFQALVVRFAGERTGILTFLRDHFAGIDIRAKVSAEAEAKVGLEDLVFPGSSLQGNQWGGDVKVEAACSLRIKRGFDGLRHQVELALSAEGELGFEGALILGGKIKGKVGAELRKIYEVPNLDDVRTWIDQFSDLLQQAPATWPQGLANKALDFGWRRLDHLRGKLSTDVLATGSLAFVAGVAVSLGREVSVEFEGDDVVATYWAALCNAANAGAEDGAAAREALRRDPSPETVVNVILNAVTGCLRVVREAGRIMADTPATFAVQDRFEGGLIFMIGWSAATCGGAVSGEATWIDKGHERKEKLPASQGFEQTLLGSFWSGVAAHLGS